MIAGHVGSSYDKSGTQPLQVQRSLKTAPGETLTDAQTLLVAVGGRVRLLRIYPTVQKI